ncbi:MAG: DUF4856 domain-containing protein [Phaeodactylibacter sp.]|nr:DUF4856 domain-containing protein [Phaeodactylibacter sp.]MCB9052115.1 DUF4856 domain-containing protein [Lewinellaceae bacterium]
MKCVRFFSLLAAIFIFVFSSCNKDEDSLVIPGAYNFENVNYDGQLQRLAMLLEIKNYITTANTPGVVLDAERLKAMYANETARAGWQGAYDASKQLKGKTFEFHQGLFEQLLEGIAQASTSAVPGGPGQAGIVASNDGGKQYLFNENGVEYAQLIEKGLMGACFYYQATAVYLGDEKMNVDNETVEPGEGTAMEHHWDEAFGYYGVPVSFPSTPEPAFFWGVYSNRRDPQLSCNQKMMDAFLKGRAAISAKKLEVRDEAIAEVRANWELISGATAISYINAALEEFDDFALRAHALSEAIAFTYALQFNPERSFSIEEANQALRLIGGGSEDFFEMNLYQVEPAQLEQAREILAKGLGLEDRMMDL